MHIPHCVDNDGDQHDDSGIAVVAMTPTKAPYPVNMLCSFSNEKTKACRSFFSAEKGTGPATPTLKDERSSIQGVEEEEPQVPTRQTATEMYRPLSPETSRRGDSVITCTKKHLGMICTKKHRKKVAGEQLLNHSSCCISV